MTIIDGVEMDDGVDEPDFDDNLSDEEKDAACADLGDRAREALDAAIEAAGWVALRLLRAVMPSPVREYLRWQEGPARWRVLDR